MIETVNSKEAAFMLDTDIEQDMKAYKDEITLQAIKFINRNKAVYERMKATKEQGASLQITAKWWAQEQQHHDEFGDLFITELESVDWDKVKKAI